LPCVVIGYRLGRDGSYSVQVATMREGVLRYVGQVRHGFGTTATAVLAPCLKLRRRTQPVVPCPQVACWVEPELYCRVRYQDWTCHGRLRHAVFSGWITAD
jgi:ATP-dependent DNA ligase